jgi:hypothetical protein
MFEKLNERTRMLTAMDIGLIKCSVFFATIIIVKLLPQLLRINYPTLSVLLVACALKPFYKFWIQGQ